jgi:hypothetical protein
MPEPVRIGEPLTTKEGWRRFVDTTTVMPSPRDERQQAPDAERVEQQEERLSYLSDPVTVNTPVIQQVVKDVRRLLILNRRQVCARRGLIVTGGAGTGKTTALTQLGRLHELALHRRQPGYGPTIPVVYITLPPAATARMLAVEFARFLGLPVTTRANITDVVNAVCGVLCDTSCQLVLVDELHNLSLATRSGAEVSDQLKYFSERIPATFVYAGIDLEENGLFNGTRGRQIASRFSVIHTRPFAYGTTAQREAWRSLVATLEQALCLHRHVPGTLARHGAYLHRRTGGMIGSLSHLVRGAAVDAILDGTEKITKAHLEAVRLDRAAAAAHPGLNAKRAARTPGSAA